MSRDAILGAIRRGLKRGPLPADQAAMLAGRIAAHPRHLVPERSNLPRPQQIALFIHNVEKEFGTVERVPNLSDIPAAVADYLAAHNLPARIVLAPHPELLGIDWSTRPMIEREARRANAHDAVSLQHAWAAVAETGTLVFPSDATRPTTLNLLPETEIVVLRASAIAGAYEAVWDRLRAGPADTQTGGFMPRNIMLVTGPSRSADIEQTLELGAHGPRRLHVLLVEDEFSPRAESPAEAREDATAQPGAPAAPGD